MQRYLPMILSCLFPAASSLFAAEPVTLENVVDPGANAKDEATAESFSLEKAVHFLDSASLNWQKERQCFTCHTNYAYLYARPLIDADVDAHRTVRSFAEKLVTERWEERGPRWDAEVVATAAALAFNDASTTGKLHPVTRTALDRMWTLQNEAGGFDWLKCDWPPMESDDDYGVSLAALAVGVAPGDYAQTDKAKAGIAGIKRFLTKNPPPTLHHRAMLLWASKHLDGLMTEKQKTDAVNELLGAQKEDGGWNLASFGKWGRDDGKEQDTETSDGYATGLAVFVLHQSGVPADKSELQKGVAWLKANQKASGRWFTRSLHKDSKHFISHAGTAFATMALATVDQAAE